MAEPFEGIRRLRIDSEATRYRFTLTALCGCCGTRGGACVSRPPPPVGELGQTLELVEALLLRSAGYAITHKEEGLIVVRCVPCRDGTRLTDLH